MTSCQLCQNTTGGQNHSELDCDLLYSVCEDILSTICNECAGNHRLIDCPSIAPIRQELVDCRLNAIVAHRIAMDSMGIDEPLEAIEAQAAALACYKQIPVPSTVPVPAIIISDADHDVFEDRVLYPGANAAVVQPDLLHVRARWVYGFSSAMASDADEEEEEEGWDSEYDADGEDGWESSVWDSGEVTEMESVSEAWGSETEVEDASDYQSSEPAPEGSFWDEF
ncbi:hypothetical protein BT63DRAFT_411151 [Microthyrium microscopicum]|uniref:Uncharacterized protein n=1 Tax=Microthyrium microscopicum TaxID=703497 RepID=A0A6A6UHY8_9PEZI|nr:hypothetical protein BT63DRAFT_411151 [Microthyrium microscopicum]